MTAESKSANPMEDRWPWKRLSVLLCVCGVQGCELKFLAIEWPLAWKLLFGSNA